jgi:hypothetical protein
VARATSGRFLFYGHAILPPADFTAGDASRGLAVYMQYPCQVGSGVIAAHKSLKINIF